MRCDANVGLGFALRDAQSVGVVLGFALRGARCSAVWQWSGGWLRVVRLRSLCLQVWKWGDAPPGVSIHQCVQNHLTTASIHLTKIFIYAGSVMQINLRVRFGTHDPSARVSLTLAEP